MRRPKRLTAFILTIIIMAGLTSAAVAADKETAISDITGYVINSGLIN